MKIRIREQEGCDPQPFLLWDTVWVNDLAGQYGDWRVVDGGLQSKAALHTAVIIQYFTHKRAPDDLPVDDDDQQGWWGESIKFAGENWEMGSLLWTLERGLLNTQTEILAKDYCEEALQCLIDQGAVAEVQIETARDNAKGILEIRTRLYAQSGDKAYDQKFDLLWETQF